jgi:hypothetical protein
VALYRKLSEKKLKTKSGFLFPPVLDLRQSLP